MVHRSSGRSHHADELDGAAHHGCCCSPVHCSTRPCADHHGTAGHFAADHGRPATDHHDHHGSTLDDHHHLGRRWLRLLSDAGPSGARGDHGRRRCRPDRP